MAARIVSYARFLEIRERRQRVVAELTTPSSPMIDPDPLHPEPMVVYCAVGGDNQAGRGPGDDEA